MLKAFYFACVVLGLTSCSGGSSSDSPSSNDNNLEPVSASASENDSDSVLSFSASEKLTQQTNAARALYDGSRKEEPLTLAAASEFVNSINVGLFPDRSKIVSDDSFDSSWVAFPLNKLTDVPLIKLNYESLENDLQSGVSSCTNGGQILVEKNELDKTVLTNYQDLFGYHHLSIDYDNCYALDATHQFNGHVDLYYSTQAIPNDLHLQQALDSIFLGAPGSTQRIRNVIIGYDGLTVEKPGFAVEITGALDWENPASCQDNPYKEVTIYFKDLNSTESVLIDSMAMGWKEFYSGGACNRDMSRMTYFKGMLFHSEYGQVHIDTRHTQYPEGTKYHSWSTAYPSSYDNSLYADLQLDSANTKAIFNDRYKRVLDDSSGLSGRRLSLYLFENEVRTDALAMSSTMFARGGMLDLDDDDNDGIGNSWEIAAGLDMENSEDAVFDSDNDSASNLEEYLHAGDPLWIENSGYSRDVSIAANTSYGTGYYDDENAIRVTVYVNRGQFLDTGNFENTTDILDDFIVVRANVPGTWNPENPNCKVDELTSKVGCPSTNRSTFNGGFTPAQDGPLTLTISVMESASDFNYENNKREFEIDYVSP